MVMAKVIRCVRWTVPVATLSLALGGAAKATVISGASDAYSLSASLNSTTFGPIAEASGSSPAPYNSSNGVANASILVPNGGFGSGALVNLQTGLLNNSAISNVDGGAGPHTTTADSSLNNTSLSLLLGSVVSLSVDSIVQNATATGDYGSASAYGSLTVTDLSLRILGDTIYSHFTGTIDANTGFSLSNGLGSVSLWLNEQNMTGDGISTLGIDTNAFHFSVDVLGLASSDVILGHAEATQSYAPNAVPEPTSVALLGLGVLGAGAVGYRKKRAVA